MSKNNTAFGPKKPEVSPWPALIHILTTERDGDDGLIATFSDSTNGGI